MLSRLMIVPTLAALICGGGYAAESGNANATSATPSAEDRAATRQALRMLKQAEEHIALDEGEAALALYEKIILRFEKQALGFTAHLCMARYLYGQGEFERAIEHFSRAASHGTGPQAIINENIEERTEALFHVGMCFVQTGKPERCFPSFRSVITIAPGSPFANKAYFQIAEAHYNTGNYSQAISNYRLVGTSLNQDQKDSGLVELGKPLYLRVEDKDLLILEGEPITMKVRTGEGDEEEFVLEPILPGSDVYVGFIATSLGPAVPGNKSVDGNGTTRVTITYDDKHTAIGKIDVPRSRELEMVGTATISATDGAFRDQISQVILDEGAGVINVRVLDNDRDTGSGTDKVEATIIVERPLPPKEPEPGEVLTEEDLEPKWEERSRTNIALEEGEIQRRGSIDLSDWTIGEDEESEQPKFETEAVGVGTRTGTFIGEAVLVGEGRDGGIEAAIGDRITVRYADSRHIAGTSTVNRNYQVTVVPGNISKLTLAGTLLKDANIKVRKELLQAETSLRIGEVYRDMGLERHAQRRFDTALDECRRVGSTDGVFDRELREQTLFTLWRIFLAKGALREAAKACYTLQQEFPESDFIDDSLLALGQEAKEAGEYGQAVQLFQQLASLPGGSLLAPEAMFEVGKVYEIQIEQVRDGVVSEDSGARQRAINAYRQVFTTFPDSAYAGEALKKTGDFYFRERNYQQAIDFFEKVLKDYPDAPFIADVLFNLSRSYFLKGDDGTAQTMIARIEREQPGYERMDQVRKLRTFVQRRARSAASN